MTLRNFCDAPVSDEELDAGPVSESPVAVVPEHPDDGGPDLGDLLLGHPGAEPDGEHRVRGEPAADPDVEAGTVGRVVHADERDVVDLRHNVLGGWPVRAVLNLRGRFEYSGSPM